MDDLKVPPFQETSKWKTINGTQMNITIKSFLLLDNQRLTMETCGNIEPIGNCGKNIKLSSGNTFGGLDSRYLDSVCQGLVIRKAFMNGVSVRLWDI